MVSYVFAALAALSPTTETASGAVLASSLAGPQVRETTLTPGTPPMITLRLRNPTRSTAFEGIYLRMKCEGADGATTLTVLLRTDGPAADRAARLPTPPDYTLALAAPLAPRTTVQVTVPLADHPTLSTCAKARLRGAW
ncbi:hypothetical protein [uncultured Tateyamaria sp.]|uniref:hypothetical protein n=1 Tax=Rhodobacterales TaxID=204455 RepID=UPI00262593C0|nr:hypothetical protein [uncultured Tateyamaria sp.]